MRAKYKRAAFGIAAIACVIALFWWGAWCFHALRGWTAVPLGLTVGGIIYGIGSVFVFAAVNVDDDGSGSTGND